MSWFRKKKPEADPTGVLFGLTPPAGCQFDVTNHHDSSWHVRIVSNGKTRAHECEFVGWRGMSDEEVIVVAAKKALASYGVWGAREARERVVSELVGLYPPKNTNNKSAAD